MAQKTTKRKTGAVPRVSGDLFQAWQKVYCFQRERLEQEYSDYSDNEDLFNFLFELAYVDPANRPQYEKRDQSFVRIARSWLFRRLTTKELREYLETVIVLRERTDKFDIKLAKYLVQNTSAAEAETLEEQSYREAYAQIAKPRERLAQLEDVLKTFELCTRIINELPFNLEQILRYTPKIFKRNVELLDMCVEAYRIFSKHKDHLAEFDRVIRERETAYINAMFDGEV